MSQNKGESTLPIAQVPPSVAREFPEKILLKSRNRKSQQVMIAMIGELRSLQSKGK
jgi:hypothetical protein